MSYEIETTNGLEVAKSVAGFKFFEMESVLSAIPLNENDVKNIIDNLKDTKYCIKLEKGGQTKTYVLGNSLLIYLANFNTTSNLSKQQLIDFAQLLNNDDGQQKQTAKLVLDNIIKSKTLLGDVESEMFEDDGHQKQQPKPKTKETEMSNIESVEKAMTGNQSGNATTAQDTNGKPEKKSKGGNPNIGNKAKERWNAYNEFLASDNFKTIINQNSEGGKWLEYSSVLENIAKTKNMSASDVKKALIKAKIASPLGAFTNECMSIGDFKAVEVEHKGYKFKVQFANQQAIQYILGKMQ